MKYFTRKQVIELLEIEESFLLQLEQEEVVHIEQTDNAVASQYSEIMLERARVADNLVNELEVNLAGAAIIVQMREDLANLRHQLENALEQLRRPQD